MFQLQFHSLILLLLLLFLIDYSKQEDACFSESYCSCTATRITCKNFTSFQQLIFNESNVIWSEIIFIPAIRVQLNNYLDISKIKFFQNTTFSFSNLESIYAYSNVFKKIKLYNKNGEPVINNKDNASLRLNIIQSFVTFMPFQNISSLNELNEYINCEYNDEKNENYIFANLSLQELNFLQSEFPNTIFICPLLFFKTTINEINFSTLKGRLAFRNVSFAEGKNSIYCNIKNVNLINNDKNFVEEIDHKTLFNEYIFEKTEKIDINGNYINSIDEKTLQKLKYLRKLNLKNIQNPASNLSIFENTNWLQSLNIHVSKNVEQLDLTLLEDVEYFSENYFSLSIYDFPDLLSEENICLITKFPVNKLIVPLIYHNKECTCSTYWLYRFYFKTNNYLNLIPNEVKSCFYDISEQNLNVRIHNCNISRRCFNVEPIEVNTTTTTTKTSSKIITSGFLTSSYMPIQNSSLRYSMKIIPLFYFFRYIFLATT